jgi:hypothetical protein
MGNLLLASSDDTPDASRGFIVDYEYLMKVNYRREGEAPLSVRLIAAFPSSEID